MIQKKYVKYFIAANIAVLLSTAALMCVPVCVINARGWEKVFSICVGLAFWSGVFGACFFDWRCRRLLKKYGKKSKNTSFFSRPNIFRFAENKYTLVIDIGMVIAVLCFLVILLFKIWNDWFVMIDIAMMFLTFGMHCIYSGKIN